MIPGSGVIAGPGEAVALAASVGGAGENEGALVGTELEKAVVGGALIFHSENVVDFGVRSGALGETRLVDAMDGIEGHGLGGSVKNGRLVHIVPESGDAILSKLFVEAAPPLASFGAGEVGENGWAGPDDANKLTAIGGFHEIVAGMARVIGHVVFVGDVSDVQIGDGHKVEVLLFEIGNQAWKVGKSARIDGKRAVLELVVDVHVHDVGGNLVGAQAVGDFADLGFRSVAVARLLEAQRPERRQWRRAGEIGVAFHHMLRSGAIDEVVVQRATLGAKRIGGAGCLAEVEPGAPGVVEEKSVAAAFADAQKERNALVEGVCGFLWADIGVPQRKRLFAAVKRSGFVAKSVEVLIDSHFLVDGKTAEAEFRRLAQSVGAEDFAGEIAHNQAQGIAFYPNLEGRGAEADGGGVLMRLGIHGLHFNRVGARGGKYRPRGIFRKRGSGGDADAQDVFA